MGRYMTKLLRIQEKTSLRPFFLHKNRGFHLYNNQKTLKNSQNIAKIKANSSNSHFTAKVLDKETGLYYYGARYLDAKTSRWLSIDPALTDGSYIPVAPNSDEARKHNQNLPGMGGVFNYVNLHVYHYGANNPIKYVDPDGREVDIIFTIKSYEETKDGVTAHGELTVTDRDTGESITVNAYSGGRGSSESGVSLPLPIGSYEILTPTNIGYRLEALDSNRGNDFIEGTDPYQGNIRLHRPGAGLSYGCIGVATNDEWQSVQNMLTNTQKGSSTIQRYRGLWMQQTTKFGNLAVRVDENISKHPRHQTFSTVDRRR